MAVKFSEFTAKLDASVDVTEVVGYLQSGELNVRIPPANLDTTYVVSTGNAGASPTINLQGTKPNQAAAIAPTTISLTGSGATLLAGNGSSIIDFGSTAYALTSTDSVVGNNSVPVVLTGTGGNDVGTDTVTIVGTGTVQVSSATNVITIDGGSIADVTSVNSGTPFNSTGAPLAISPTLGAVIVSSAIYNGGTNIGVVPGGGAPTTFLKGDGSWAIPTNSGGTVTSVGLSTNVAALTVADTPVTSSGTLALNKNGGTAGQYIDGDTGAWTDLPAGYTLWSANSDQNTNLSITDGTVLNFSGRVASDGAYGSGLGLGAGIYTDTAINTGEVTTGLIINGGTPSATTFYRGDGNWATVAGGYTTERVAASTTVSAVKDYLYILANPLTVTITLPASPADGDTIGIANNFVASGGNITNQLVAPGTGGNTDKIMGDTSNLVIDNGSAAFDLVFSSADAPNGNGWTIVGAN